MGRFAAALAGLFVVLAPLAAQAAHGHHHAHAAATRITDPAAFIADVYRALARTDQDPGPHGLPGDDIYTPRLAALFALDRRETPRGDEGRLNIAFWIDGNGGDVEKDSIRVRAEDVENAPARRIVVANFVSAGEAKEVRFYFEKLRGRWLIDDVRIAGPNGWTLSTVLKYGDDRPVVHGAGFETPPKP